MICERIVVPSVLYGAEPWALKEREKKTSDVMEIKFLRSMCGVTRMDRNRIKEIRRRMGV